MVIFTELTTMKMFSRGGTERASPSFSTCDYFAFVRIGLCPLPLIALIARGVNIDDIHFLLIRCREYRRRTDGFCADTSPRVLTFLRVLSLFLSLSLSLAYSFTQACLSSFIRSSSLSPCFLLSSALFFQSPLSSSRSLSQSPILVIPRVWGFCVRVVRPSRGGERDPRLFFHHQSSEPGSHSRIPKDERQLRYSHSRPTCRIIRNSPAKTRTTVVSLTVLDKHERIRYALQVRDTVNVLAVKFPDHETQSHSKAKMTLCTDWLSKGNLFAVWIFRI